MGAATRFLSNPPRVRAVHTSGTSLGNAAWGAVVWGGIDGSDYEGMVSGSRITIPAAGRYLVSWQVGFAGDPDGGRFTQLRRGSLGSVTGGAAIAAARGLAIGSSTVFVGGTTDAAALAAGEYFELFAYQSSGGALALTPGAAETWISVRWVALD